MWKSDCTRTTTMNSSKKLNFFFVVALLLPSASFSSLVFLEFYLDVIVDFCLPWSEVIVSNPPYAVF